MKIKLVALFVFITTATFVNCDNNEWVNVMAAKASRMHKDVAKEIPLNPTSRQQQQIKRALKRYVANLKTVKLVMKQAEKAGAPKNKIRSIEKKLDDAVRTLEKASNVKQSEKKRGIGNVMVTITNTVSQVGDGVKNMFDVVKDAGDKSVSYALKVLDGLTLGLVGFLISPGSSSKRETVVGTLEWKEFQERPEDDTYEYPLWKTYKTEQKSRKQPKKKDSR